MRSVSLEEQTYALGRRKSGAHFSLNSGDLLSYSRFENAYLLAKALPINKETKLIMFSDSHRGDNGVLDRFSQNKRLFLHALSHYDRAGYTYLEVGDGDELWHVDDFSKIETAHPDVFRQLRRFDHDNRLHLIMGNHDVGRDKRLAHHKIGVPMVLGLRLSYGHDREFFVTHGHQSDFYSGYFTRLVARYFAKLFKHQVGTTPKTVQNGRTLGGRLWKRVESELADRVTTLENRILRWVRFHPKTSIICGHTHRVRFGEHDYYNTGSCLTPGLLTGLEISAGAIKQIRWTQSADNQIQQQTTQQIQFLT